MPSASQGRILWFTGLSGSGKSTIATKLSEKLKTEGHLIEILDGDLLRGTLSKDLGFSKEDRNQNIERAAFLAKLLSKHGVWVLATFITPYENQRQFLRKTLSSYVEIFVNAPLTVCEKRDVKGLYQKARKGEVKSFTGISDVFEPPQKSDVELRTDLLTIEECVGKVFNLLKR